MNDQYASEDFTKEYLELSQLPEPLRLAAALEKTMQWPLHGKAADCLRKLHAELESIKQAITDPENQPSQFGTVLMKEWVGLTDEEIGDFASGYRSGRIGSFVELTEAIEAKLKEKNT